MRRLQECHRILCDEKSLKAFVLGNSKIYKPPRRLSEAILAASGDIPTSLESDHPMQLGD